MGPSKRKRLETEGWKIGSATELVGLSASEQAVIEARLRRIGHEPHGFPADAELNAAADEIFRALDKSERQGRKAPAR